MLHLEAGVKVGIHAEEDLPAAQRKAAEIVARLKDMRLGKAAELVETAVSETLWAMDITYIPMARGFV